MGIMLLCMIMSACAPQSVQLRPVILVDTATPEKRSADLYRAPTAAPDTPLALPIPSDTATASLPTDTPRPTATQICSDDLLFLEDLTIPDGTVVLPGLPVDKRWRVENNGSCNWDESYRLRLIEGASLGAASEQALYPARSGTQAVIRILFTAPLEPGRYRSAWQAHNPRGEPFGQLFYLEIIVE
jgi:hypothetical protein